MMFRIDQNRWLIVSTIRGNCQIPSLELHHKYLPVIPQANQINLRNSWQSREESRRICRAKDAPAAAVSLLNGFALSAIKEFNGRSGLLICTRTLILRCGDRYVSVHASADPLSYIAQTLGPPGATLRMAQKRARPFNTDAYLATEGPGRKIIHLRAKQILSSQGDPADPLFYLRMGRAKLTIVSKSGKEAAVTLLASGDFFGILAGGRDRGNPAASPRFRAVMWPVFSPALIRRPVARRNSRRRAARSCLVSGAIGAQSALPLSP